MPADRGIEQYYFRDLHPLVNFGTASDRYAGWIGQIYGAEWEAHISSRRRKLGKSTFEERQVPIASVAEYFERFDVLELDFTFYQPLLNDQEKANNAWRVLSEYAHHAPDDARFILKLPQMFSARTLRRGRGAYESNERYLDAAGYEKQFLKPALDILGDRASAFIFEQEYQRVRDCPPSEEIIAGLDRFFVEVPHNVPIHLELRSPHLLTDSYFDWLESRALGFVFSHWTWLPPIREQWKRCGGRLTSADRQVIVRLLTPLRMTYDKAYALAHPFDGVAEGLSNPGQVQYMVDDTVALAFRALEKQFKINILANNRAIGSAPELNRLIAERFLEMKERR